MKKILEFDSPEDDELFELSNKGPEYSFVISDFLEYLRNEQKYKSRDTIDIDEAREKLISLLDMRDVPIP